MRLSADVAIIGAGIAGCHLAQLLSSNNVKTILVDKMPLSQAGPQWINGVPDWIFDEANLLKPKADELFDCNDRFIIQAGDKHHRVTINNLGLLDVHMGHLGTRLKNYFLPHGSFVQVVIKGSKFKKNRLVEVEGQTPQGESANIKAKLFIDASGTHAVVRKNHPLADRFWPKVKREDFCIALQATYAINDRHGAHNFLEYNQVSPGDILSQVGISGGYSLFRWQVDHQSNHVSFLCGVRALSSLTPSFIVEQFIKNNPWVGTGFIKGQGAIPINAPYHDLIAPGLALLGDSAGQVHAAHGSGIGIGLLAATILAETIIDAHKKDKDIGSKRVLRKYPGTFHRRYYKRLYFAEQFRRFSQELNQFHTMNLIKSGIFNGHVAKQTLLQKNLKPELRLLSSIIPSVIKFPKTAVSLMPLLGKMLQGELHARRLSAFRWF